MSVPYAYIEKNYQKYFSIRCSQWVSLTIICRNYQKQFPASVSVLEDENPPAFSAPICIWKCRNPPSQLHWLTQPPPTHAKPHPVFLLSDISKYQKIALKYWKDKKSSSQLVLFMRILKTSKNISPVRYPKRMSLTHILRIPKNSFPLRYPCWKTNISLLLSAHIYTWKTTKKHLHTKRCKICPTCDLCHVHQEKLMLLLSPCGIRTCQWASSKLAPKLTMKPTPI